MKEKIINWFKKDHKKEVLDNLYNQCFDNQNLMSKQQIIFNERVRRVLKKDGNYWSNGVYNKKEPHKEINKIIEEEKAKLFNSKNFTEDKEWGYATLVNLQIRLKDNEKIL